MRVDAPPRSDQWNAEDFTGGPRTFTIAAVKPGKAEQKYDIELVEGEGRVWRPPLTVLRLLIAAWTNEAESWRGRQVTLYLDPEVQFGKEKVGGIRVSHLSGITEPLTVALSVKRGRRAPFTVLPIADGAGEHLAALAAAASIDELRAAWDAVVAAGLSKRPDLIAAKDERKAALSEAPAGETPGEREPGRANDVASFISPLPVNAVEPDPAAPSEAEWAQLRDEESER